MRKTSQQDLPSQQHQSPRQSLTLLLSFSAHHLIRHRNLIQHRITIQCRVVRQIATILAAIPILGALSLQPLAHAVPLENGDFVRSDTLLPLPKISEQPKVSEQPRVSVTKFTARGKHGGRWRGRVFGSGPTALILRFFKDDTLVKKKLIGRVHLDSEPQGVRFSYSGVMPKMKKTRWDIIALYEKTQ
jgi:hypothetical protein